MRKNNIPHDIQSRPVSQSSSFDTDSPSVTPDGHYDNDDSELYISVMSGEDDDEWLVTATMTLRDRKKSIRDASIVDDGFGISYDSTEWSALEPTEQGVTTWSETQSSDSVSLDYQEFKPDAGVAYNVDVPWDMGGRTTVSLQTWLTRNESTENDDIPVKAEYNHTWAALDIVGPVDATASAEIGPIGLEMSLDNASILWENEVSAEAGNSNTVR